MTWETVTPKIENARKTAFNWLMARATNKITFHNAMIGKKDSTDHYSFGGCPDDSVEHWLEQATKDWMMIYS